DDMFLPALIKAMRSNKPLAMTWGEQTRDYLYIDDLLQALLAAAKHPELKGQVLNIGAGQSVKLKEIVQHLEKMLERPGIAQLGQKPYRPNEIMHYAVDISKAQQALN